MQLLRQMNKPFCLEADSMASTDQNALDPTEQARLAYRQFTQKVTAMVSNMPEHLKELYDEKLKFDNNDVVIVGFFKSGAVFFCFSTSFLFQPLTYKESCKYLGLHLDGSLRFREHIDYVVKKRNQFSGLIHRIREQYTRSSLLMFYNSFAKSVLSYALISYGTAAKTNLMKVENAQRRILRAIFFRRKFDSLYKIWYGHKIQTVF